jgi:hypothetical protein
MCDQIMSKAAMARVPSWVPEAALHYLAHIESGTPIRALARRSGRHASTVLRQIRAFETRRDDILVDEALRRLGQSVSCAKRSGSPVKEIKMTVQTDPASIETETGLSQARLQSEAGRVLRRLCETGALLAVSADMDKAVVVRDGGASGPARTAVVDRDVAEALALNGWIACDNPGRISRYHVTGAGRAALGRFMAEAENVASGLREPPVMVDGDKDTPADKTSRRMRYGLAESPLIALARRRDKDGSRFLSHDLVRAGERLREDFELAQMGPRLTQNWDHFLSHVDQSGAPANPPGYGADAARARVIGALRDLGPGLGDVALRCCCYLEGLERAEQKMGWSARSGKIVLRIALQRLKRHYEELGDAGGMIG